MKLYFIFFVCYFFSFVLNAQVEIVEYDQVEWTRKENREEIARIYYGEVDEAISNMKEQMKEPGKENDPELLFGLSLAWSVKGDANNSFRYFEQALEQGLPVTRFMTKMPGFETLYDLNSFQERIEPHKNQPVHGPLLGAMTDNTSKIWFRTWDESNVQVSLFAHENGRKKIIEETARTKAKEDYTAVVEIDGLKPDTRYYYRLTINGEPSDSTWSMKTVPATGEPGVFKVGFGGCSAYNPTFERIWDTIATHDMDVFLTLGDNVYSNHHTLPQVNRFCYYQRQSRPEFKRFSSTIPYFGIWDDHDFGENDSYGGPKKYEPEWKVDILNVFKENFANPYYASNGLPGVYFDYKIGDVQFFMLDGRYYREPSTLEDPSMLGEAQKEWLKKELLNSNATFKVIVSPVNWSDDSKGLMAGRIDTWEGYKKEREEIFSFLGENKIQGVFLLSADRHRHDVWRHDRGSEYPLYEFTSSRLTNIHYHALMSEALFGYNEKNGFAVLKFNTEAKYPYVVYTVYSIDNELIQRIRVYLHQMSAINTND
ncbi:MAG: alkaline phosphatase D family protein [Bacteroidota bacterium]